MGVKFDIGYTVLMSSSWSFSSSDSNAFSWYIKYYNFTILPKKDLSNLLLMDDFIGAKKNPNSAEIIIITEKILQFATKSESKPNKM